MNNNAKWIWYKGDFELFLGLRVHSSRFQRGTQITPIWRIDTPSPNVKFHKKFKLEYPEKISIITDGEAAVELDGPGHYLYSWRVGIDLSAGEHDIVITVFNNTTFPSLLIDGDQLITDSTWEVSCVDGKWELADSWFFSLPDQPPSKYKLNTKAKSYLSKKEINNGTIYDFGKEVMGYVQLLNVIGNGNATICYGESIEEALDVDNCEMIDKITINSDYCTQISKGFRYLFILTDDSLKIGNIGLLYEYLPLVNHGDFKCDNPLVNKIYDVSLYTLHLNSREFFLDGIKRDRWVWGGDVSEACLLNYYSFFDNDICKRSLRLLLGKKPITRHINTIQDYTLFWFISIFDYYLYTGDTSFIIQMYEDAKSLFAFCEESTDENGFLIAKPNDWVFVDWAPINNQGILSVIQILYARSLECLAMMAEVCGDKIGTDLYRTKLSNLMNNIFKFFWNENLGGFIHSSSRESNNTVTKYANMFALLFGYLNEEQIKSVKDNVLLNDNILKITTPYMKFYEVAALCEIGCYDCVSDYIKQYWGGMLECGATTFWEQYDPNVSGKAHYEMYGRPYGKSLCHAWGAGPLLILGKYFMGVKPLSPGYKNFIVAPNLVGFREIKGKVPTPNGVVSVELTNNYVTVDNQTPFEGTLIIDNNKYQIGGNQTISVERHF